eukprot:PITA_06586
MSMLDGFSGYNQILVHPDDQEKTAFTTPWGTFMYAKMPFGLMNAGETFQRAMDIAFAEEKDKSVVVYLEDITIFSNKEEDHLKHLERVLLKCRSKTLANAELKYNILEKQAYALVKAIKDFKIYVFHSHIVAYVPNTVIKDILTQADLDGKRGRWIAKLLEYDIEIKPTKLVKGQGLAKLLTQSNLDCIDINLSTEISEISENEEELAQINEKFLISDWYKDIAFVLQHNRAPDNLSKSKSRFTKLISLRYFVYDQNLFWKDAGGILLKCLIEEEADKVIDEFHKGDCGGHHYWKATANKVLRAGYFWPTMFRDIYKRIATCHEC